MLVTVSFPDNLPRNYTKKVYLTQELRVLLAHGTTVLNSLHKNLKAREVSNVTVLGSKIQFH